ncbi:MAG TPA: hypothetical protein VLY87_03900 [Flavobacterium sp.]|nr:hypothetical protein [Flavobacterium sp.]
MSNITLLVFVFLSLTCTAQTVIIKQDKKQSLAKSIPYPFSLSGKNCESYIITTNNGKIEQYNSECKFLLYPENTGNVKITVKNKSGKILLEESYGVKNIEFFINVDIAKENIDNPEIFLNHSRLQLYSPDLEYLNFEWNCEFELIHIKENKKSHYSMVSRHCLIKCVS